MLYVILMSTIVISLCAISNVGKHWKASLCVVTRCIGVLIALNFVCAGDEKLVSFVEVRSQKKITDVLCENG